LYNGEYRKGYTGRNICILSYSQTVIKALDSFQINSKLVWDCYHSLVKLAEHNRIILVCVLGHMGINGNEIAGELARQGSLHPLIGPERALGIFAKVARGVSEDWTSRKCEHWQSICGETQAKGFLKKPSAKRPGELLNLSRNQLRILTGPLTGHFCLKGCLLCDRCKQASEKVPHVL
jgi:hypothetical protein